MRVLVLILCTLLVCNAQYSTTITAAIPSSQQISVTLDWYPGQTVAAAMIQAVTASNGKFNYAIQYASAEYGGFVTEVCSISNASPTYWLYTVNSAQPQVGIDFYVLSNGDIVLWNFTDTSLFDLKQNFISKIL